MNDRESNVAGGVQPEDVRYVLKVEMQEWKDDYDMPKVLTR
jgi:hypothetical protein